MKRNILTIIPLLVCMVLALLLVSGCGDGKTKVQGKVTYDGKPVERGSVAFVGEKGQGTVFGEQFTGGRYAVRLPKGEFLVKINGFETVQLDTPIPGGAGLLPRTETTKSIIPGKYNMFSQMIVEIDGSKKVFDFDLEKTKD